MEFIKLSHVLLVMPHTQFDTHKNYRKISFWNFAKIFVTPRCKILQRLLCTFICDKCFFLSRTLICVYIYIRVPFYNICK